MFGPMPPSTQAEMKAQITAALLDIVGAMEPIYDAADGMRRDLERRGWSPAMAEQCAGVWLMTTLQAIAGGGR